MLKNKRLWIIVAVVILVPIAGVAWWLGSPLLFDDVVDEEFPMASSATIPTDTTREEVEKVMEVLARVEDETDEPMPKDMEETALKTGSFRDADRFHKGEGQATIHVLEDGTRILRFEDFRVTNGPSLRVILATTADPSSSSEVLQGAYVDLGTLKGNVGNQNYPIPDDTDLSAINSIVIYCKPFKVVFSVATLQ